MEGYPTKTVFYDLVSTTIKTCKDAGAQYEGQFGTITIINGTSELGTLIWTAKDLDSGRCADTKAGTFKTINISELAEYLGVTDLVGE